MSTVQALGAAVMALMPAVSGVPVFEGRATATTGAWFVVDQRLPRVVERSEAATPQAHRCMMRVRIVNQTANGCRILANHAIDALEGARPVAPGWMASPLRGFNEREPIPDVEVTVPSTNLTYMVAVLEFEFTATRIP